MIKNPQILRNLEIEYLKKEKMTIKEKYKILDSMYRFAKKLGVFEKNSLEGIEKDIKLAKVINNV